MITITKELTKEQLIEDLKASTQSASGMFEISEDTICALMSMLSDKPSPACVPDEMTPKQASRSYCGEVRGYRDGWNACRSAMLNSFGNSEQLDEVGSWNNHRNTPTAHDGNHTEQNIDMVDHFGDATKKAMLHCSEPETDNTNQQFESLGRGDK